MPKGRKASKAAAARWACRQLQNTNSDSSNEHSKRQQVAERNNQALQQEEVAVQLYPAWLREQPVGAGYINNSGALHNVCFLNSVLQCLAHCPPVGNLLISELGWHRLPCTHHGDVCMACAIHSTVRAQLEGAQNAAVFAASVYYQLMAR